MKALVTGATGFIGSALCHALYERGDDVRALVRHPERLPLRPIPGTPETHRGDLSRPETLSGIADGIDTVFHLAGNAHAEDEGSQASDARHEDVTVRGTRALLDQCARAPVSRIVFASSVKAMGEGTHGCADEQAATSPTTAYGRAKRDAEVLVLDWARATGRHAAVVRLPMVYGAGHRGNLPRMVRAISAGVFPPLPKDAGERSMVSLRDAVRALMLVADHSGAAGKAWLVTDGERYTSRWIADWITEALGRRPPRWSVPRGLWLAAGWGGDLAGWLLRRPMPLDSARLGKLLGEACYSSDRIRTELGFRSTQTLRDVLPAIVAEALNK